MSLSLKLVQALLDRLLVMAAEDCDCLGRRVSLAAELRLLYCGVVGLARRRCDCHLLLRR